MKKVNIYYNNDELTGDDEIKVLEIPDEIIDAIAEEKAENNGKGITVKEMEKKRLRLLLIRKIR